MKKLMIAVAAVACAAVTNAANFSWTAAEDNIVGIDGVKVESGYTGWLMNNATVTLTDAIALADAGDFSFISKNINDGGEGAEVADGFTGTLTVDTLTPSTTYDVYAVLIDAASAGSATKAYFTGLNAVALDQYGSVESTTDGYEWGAAVYDFTSTKVADNWHGPSAGPTEDIPEPTSALLMLVGMAGLALRRKQA